LRKKCPSALPFPFGNTKSCGSALRSVILALIFHNSFAGIGIKRSLGRFVLLFALELEFAPRLRLYMQGALLPVEIVVLRILHFGISGTGIQEQTVKSSLPVIHRSEQRLEFLLRIRLNRAPSALIPATYSRKSSNQRFRYATATARSSSVPFLAMTDMAVAFARS
jgi:hypothetical protein